MLECKFRMMRGLGTDLLIMPMVVPSDEYLTMEPDTSYDLVNDIGISNLRAVAAFAASHHKRIALHTTSNSEYGHWWQTGVEAVMKVDKPNMGLCLDSFQTYVHPRLQLPCSANQDNFIHYKALLAANTANILKIPKEKIFAVYLSDVPPFISLKPWEFGVHYRTFPGLGLVPVVEFIQAVRANGYRGQLTTEVLNEQYAVAEMPRTLSLTARRSLLLVFSEVYDSYHHTCPTAETAPPSSPTAEGVGPEVPAAEPSGANMAGEALPHPGTIYGVDFIEFAIDEARAEAMGRWFERIGLRRLARHKSRNVVLYRGGRVNILINYESTSVASAMYLVRGICTTMIGVRVSNVPAIIERAKCLCYPIAPISRMLQLGEHFMAIQAPDDTFIILLEDSTWIQDFQIEVTEELTEKCKEYAEAFAFERIDHVSHALERSVFHSFLLFYKALFAMEADSWTVQELSGLPKSRAMVSMPLTMPREDESRSADVVTGGLKFPISMLNDHTMLDAHYGKNRILRSALNHVALLTTDIFKLVETMQKSPTHDQFTYSDYRGRSPFLTVPAKYYEGLKVKYPDLAPEFIARMQENSILYDRDDHGEFLHINTEQFEEGFFFEIVERRGGYRFFGRANLPVRMVAQQEIRMMGRRIKTQIRAAEAGWKSEQEQVRERKRRRLGSVSASSSAKRTLPPVVVLVGKERLRSNLNLTADILGCKSAIIHTWDELLEVEGKEDGIVVLGIDEEVFVERFFNTWESAGREAPEIAGRKRRRVLLCMICVDYPDESAERVSEMCDHEFYYIVNTASTPCLRQVYARFLSFILGLTVPHPHDRIASKKRSTVLVLNNTDVRQVLESMDITTLGTDAVEIRADLLREPGRLGRIPSVRYMGEQVMWLRQRTALPIIFTLRSIEQAGNFPTERPEVVHCYLRKALQWGVEYIDVEVKLPTTVRSNLFHRRGSTKVISSHCSTAGSKLDWLSADAQRIYHSARMHGDIVRMMGFAEKTTDNYELEYFRAGISKPRDNVDGNAESPPQLIVFNTGREGQLSKVLNQFMTPVTHAMLPMSMPGQLTVAEIISALHIIGQLPQREFFTITILPPNVAPPGSSSTASGSSRSPHASGSYAELPSAYSTTFGLDATISGGPTPVTKFVKKCLKELDVKHNLTSLILPHETAYITLQKIFYNPQFGGASFATQLPISHFMQMVTPAAKAIGSIDVVYTKSDEAQGQVVVGGNALWRSITGVLLTDFSREAYRGVTGLVAAYNELEAAPAVYALRSLGVSTIYMVGFGKSRRRGGHASGVLGAPEGDVTTVHFGSFEELRTVKMPFVMVSVFPMDHAQLAGPLLKEIAACCKKAVREAEEREQAQAGGGTSGQEVEMARRKLGRVFVEVITRSTAPAVVGGMGGLSLSMPGGVSTGVPTLARELGWEYAYEGSEVELRWIAEKFITLLDQHVSMGLMKMVAADRLL
ncbi:type I 3-dehydroquinase-domain-containing protein [Kalaharituber pfeilii]|nr:type I 3-dehydroquinase-domain-containing protein [Kalaharituber pfeilii]